MEAGANEPEGYMSSEKTTTNDPSAASFKEQALANFRPTPEEKWSDLFVVLRFEGEPFVKSGQIVLEDTLRQFSICVREWAFVGVLWRCDDRGIDSRGLAEILKSNTPDLYHVDVQNDALIPLDDALYQQISTCPDREFRQFAFLTGGCDPQQIDAALRERIRRVHGWPLENPLTWRKRDNRSRSQEIWFTGLTLREAQKVEAEIAADARSSNE
jgi:hypothetical protein